jgi:hypothetical protein
MSSLLFSKGDQFSEIFNALKKQVFLVFCDVVGVPLRVRHSVDPESRISLLEVNFSKTARLDDVIPWKKLEDISKEGFLYSSKVNGHRSFRKLKNSPLEQLIIEKHYPEWRSDIRNVQTLGASKGNLSLYKTLDDFTDEECQPELELNPEETLSELLERNLRHEKIGADTPREVESLYSFVWRSWDGRLGLSNSGGSHHFCAARMLAKRLNIEVLLNRHLRSELLNRNVVWPLLLEFHIFATPFSEFYGEGKLREALESFNAPYGLLQLPSGFFTNLKKRKGSKDGEIILLFLEKKVKRSDKAAMAIARDVLDFGQILLTDFEKSERNERLVPQ